MTSCCIAWHSRRRTSASRWGAALLACFTFSAPLQAQAPASPRVLVVDLDDVGYDLLRETPTPTLDWIEAHGRFFTAFTASPLCSPTRAMMNTGAYPSHPDVLLGQVVDPFGLWALPAAPLEPLASIIAAAGYSTAKVGKWHLAPRWMVNHPHAFGWQHYSGSIANVQDAGHGYARYPKVTNGALEGVSGRYLTTDETEDALALVRGGVDLVSVSYHAPHRPWHEPPAHLHSIAPILTDRDRARAMLQACDRELGRLLREALALGYTVLVFSDNGTAEPLGGQKGTLYEGGVVVPLWAIGPGVAPGRDDTRVGVVDLYATVAELFGVATGPPWRGPHSRSFVAALAGRPGAVRWTYSERFQGPGQDPRSSGIPWRRMVRGERYKLLRNQDTPGDRLVDLVNDPAETIDLLQGPPLAPDAQAALDLFLDVLARL